MPSRRGSIVLNESMEITEDVGRIVSALPRVTVEAVVQELGLGHELTHIAETIPEEKKETIPRPADLYSLNSSVDTAANLHLYRKYQILPFMNGRARN